MHTRKETMRRPFAITLGFWFVALALLMPASALAHGGHGPANVQTFTQAVGPYELAVTLELPLSVPSPLYLTVAPQGDVSGTSMEFRAVPRGQSFGGAPVAQIQALPGPQGVYFSELPIDRAGDWEIEARMSGPQGAGVARLPFTITPQPIQAISLGLLAALGGLVVLMVISIILGVGAQRRGRPTPGWANWLLGQGMFACLLLAVVFGVQQFSSQLQSAQAAAAAVANPLAASGRPHANMALGTAPAAPLAGQPLTLTLTLSDGSTGLPIEDIVPHHEALIHLVVISEDSGFFNHIHPPRLGPGQYAIALTPDRPGRYSVYAELQRLDSGTQVISRDFEVGGAASAAPPPTSAGLGTRTVAGMQVEVSASVAAFKVGRQATFTFSFRDAGGPVQDLQPWLGMGGHMMARSADAAIFAHVHAQGPMAPAGVLESGIIYGPQIQFVYTFPQPGRYQVWGQFKRNGQIVTVPLMVEVAE